MASTETIELPNSALVVSGINDLAVKPYPLVLSAIGDQPIIPDGHVLLKVKATGICGSDIHFWKDGQATGSAVFSEPFVLGHECAGEIAEVGPNVKGWEQGDRVVIKPAAPCLKCFDCTTGQSNLCPNVRHFGVPGCDGSAMTYKVVPQEQLARLTPKISWAEAGAIQPLAVAIQMSRRAGSFVHKTVAIFGGGCIGLYLGKIAKVYGADKVVVIEKEPHRAQFATKFTADQVFVNSPRSPSESLEDYSSKLAKHILDNVKDLNRGFDIVIEAAGAAECMNTGIRVVRPNGIYVQVGVYAGEDPRMPMLEVLAKQLTIRGTYRYTTDCFEQAISLIDRDQVPVKDIISHVYHFNDSVEAFEAVLNVKDKNGRKCLKTVILHDEKDVTAFNGGIKL